MAPIPPMGREPAIERARGGNLPFSFGSPHPTVAILVQDGVYRIRELVVSAAEERAAYDRAMAEGSAWMPEHHHALGRPTGAIYAEAASIAELVAAMEAMSWPADW